MAENLFKRVRFLDRNGEAMFIDPDIVTAVFSWSPEMTGIRTKTGDVFAVQGRPEEVEAELRRTVAPDRPQLTSEEERWVFSARTTADPSGRATDRLLAIIDRLTAPLRRAVAPEEES